MVGHNLCYYVNMTDYFKPDKPNASVTAQGCTL